MKTIYKVITFVACLGLLSQCAPDGEYDHPINHDNIPDVPIIFPGATTFGANPYYQVGWQGGAAPIQITIDVAEGSTQKIKEVTKMIAGTTSITPATLASAANYLAAPIAANGGAVVISTSITEFNAKMPAATDVTQTLVTNAAASTPATPYVERAFMFIVTLEDDSQIITQQLRFRVTKDF